MGINVDCNLSFGIHLSDVQEQNLYDVESYYTFEEFLISREDYKDTEQELSVYSLAFDILNNRQDIPFKLVMCGHYENPDWVLTLEDYCFNGDWCDPTAIDDNLPNSKEAVSLLSSILDKHKVKYDPIDFNWYLTASMG